MIKPCMQTQIQKMTQLQQTAKHSKAYDPNTLNGPHPGLIHPKDRKFPHRRMRNAEGKTTKGEEIRIPGWRSEISTKRLLPDER